MDKILELSGGIATVEVRRWNGKMHLVDTYRYASQVPLRDGEDALLVDWCELTSLSVSYGTGFNR